MTPAKYAPIWHDLIESSTYTVCKCGDRKRTVERRLHAVGELVVSVPVRECLRCDRGDG